MTDSQENNVVIKILMKSRQKGEEMNRNRDRGVVEVEMEESRIQEDDDDHKTLESRFLGDGFAQNELIPTSSNTRSKIGLETSSKLASSRMSTLRTLRRPTPLQSPAGKRPYFDANLFTTKQTIMQGLLELALLTTNAAQMRNIAETGKELHPFYVTCMFCVSTSLLIQLVVGVLLIINGRYNLNRWSDERKADLFANIIFILIFIVTIINIFLSTFRT